MFIIKQLKWQQIVIIMSIPFISFGIFQRHLNHMVNHQKVMLTESLRANAIFLTKPTLSGDTLKGKLQMGNAVYNYYYKRNKTISSSNLTVLNHHSCNIQGSFKSSSDSKLSGNLYVKINRIDFTSCKLAHKHFMYLIEQHKQYIYHRLVTEHSYEPAKIIALITGDTTKLQDYQLDQLKEIGIYHLLAISGTHISALIGILFYILNKIRCPLFIIKCILFSLLPVYTFYTGMAPSAIRAAFVALILILVPKSIYKHSLNIFSFAFILITLIFPQLIYNIGFQFSFFITFCILFSLPIMKNANILKSTIFISIIAQLASLIISAIHFNQIQWVGVLANLFFVPFYTFILFPSTLLYFFILHFPFNLSLFTKFMNIILILHDKVICIFMKITTIKWYTPELSQIHITIIIFLILTAIIILVHKRYFIFIIVFIILFFVVTILPNSDEYKLTMLNVNQGDAILFETAKQESMLIDTGGVLSRKGDRTNHMLSKLRILPTLKKHGLRKLNYLIITHPHVDHMGELSYLIGKYQIEHIIINKDSFNINQLNALETQCQKHGIKLLDFKYFNHFVLSKANINLLNATIQNSTDLNEHSIITLIQYNNIKILLMGDASKNNESLLLKKYNLKNLDILKVGHHGSKTSSGSNFINIIHPRISLISVGQKNKYNLPNIEVIYRLKAMDSKIYMTSHSGEVTITLSKDIQIKTQHPN
ncbi:DNA internalization-related competence protein ComEC/Rec2 [Staphylococcus edaphicus]|nr:DNA internalization-related competence protein ComEC/Rec2 [Staphylococcus edaphicus]